MGGTIMKKLITLALAVLLCLSVFGALADNIKMDSLKIEFVPSKDADVIITGTQNLPELIQAEMANQGYDIGEVDITVGTSYAATGEALAAGSIDLGWLPAGTYILYSDEVDVILTATRNGLSNDSEDPATWNGDANKTLKNGPQVTFYRALIYATPSAYGKELAAKANAGEALTWDDLNNANWAVLQNSSSAGYIYPTLWLYDNYGKKITDLSKVTTLQGYGEAFAQAADATGKMGMGREDSIWNEMNVIGVTKGIYNDTVSITKAKDDVYNPEFVNAIQTALINIINTPEGKAIFDVYSHTGYAKAVDSDYDAARAAQDLVR